MPVSEAVEIPLFLLFVFIGTMIYNLVAFPFADSNRLKLFFLQEVESSHRTHFGQLRWGARR
jgi:uncharacterized membrane protein